jgi:hypothetical protein
MDKPVRSFRLTRAKNGSGTKRADSHRGGASAPFHPRLPFPARGPRHDRGDPRGGGSRAFGRQPPALARRCRGRRGARAAQGAGAGRLAQGLEPTEFNVYPPDIATADNSRRRACGEALYQAIGIARDDKPARWAQFLHNYDLFGAPVGLFFSLDRAFDRPQWADCVEKLGLPAPRAISGRAGARIILQMGRTASST